MIEIHLEQGTQDWLNWRAGRSFVDLMGAKHEALDDGGPRITATAASVCGGSNPFQKPHELWGEMLGLRKRQTVSFAMIRGHELEPKARAAYCKFVGEEYEPICIQSSKDNWIAASLDGIDLLRTRGVEIKCPISEKTHDFALQGQVPPYYFDQIQWQFLASDNLLQEIDYYSYAPKLGDANPVTVVQDKARQLELIEASMRFRMAVITRVPLSGSEFEQAAKVFLVLNRKFKMIKEQLEKEKEEVKKIANGKSMQGGGVIVSVSNPEGRVNWESVAKELIGKLQLPEAEVATMLLSHKGKPTVTISVKESAEADAIYAQIIEQSKATTETSIPISDDEIKETPQVAPVW